MGAFTGLKNASRGFTSNPLRPGRYLCRIDGCDFFDTDSKGEMWKNTLTIIGVEDGDMKVGEEVHTFFKVGSGKVQKDVFQRNLKSYLASVLDVPDEDIGEEAGTEACGEGSPMLGLVTLVTARKQTSKTANEDGSARQYTVYGWGPSLSDDQIVEAIGQDEFDRFFPKQD